MDSLKMKLSKSDGMGTFFMLDMTVEYAKIKHLLFFGGILYFFTEKR